MKAIYLLGLALRVLILSSFCVGPIVRAAPPPLVSGGAVIIVEPLSSAHLSGQKVIAEYGMSFAGLSGIGLDQNKIDLPTYGEAKGGVMCVVVMGAVSKRGKYYINDGASMAVALSEAGGLSRLATSRFVLRRGELFFRIYIGNSGHSVSPITKDILALITLKEGDVVWVAEPTP